MATIFRAMASALLLFSLLVVATCNSEGLDCLECDVRAETSAMLQKKSSRTFQAADSKTSMEEGASSVADAEISQRTYKKKNENSQGKWNMGGFVTCSATGYRCDKWNAPNCQGPAIAGEWEVCCKEDEVRKPGSAAEIRRWPVNVAVQQLKRRHAVLPRKLSRSDEVLDALQETSRYPLLDLEAFGKRAVKLREEPPVWLLRGFLEPSECDTLIAEGRQGHLPEVSYEGSYVIFDEDRVRPLLLAPPLCAGVSYTSHQGDMALAGLAFLASLAAVEGLKAALRWFLCNIAASGGQGGARFLGKKWKLFPPGSSPEAGQQISEAAAATRARLMERVRSLCGLGSTELIEPPLLTRYQDGEGQSLHVDTRERPGVDATKEAEAQFRAMGGQRMVQCLCYLNDVDVEAGGATVFVHDSLGDLRVQPEQGAALVFCPSFKDCTEDLRMSHFAEPVQGPVEKWIVPVWTCESEHTGWRV